METSMVKDKALPAIETGNGIDGQAVGDDDRVVVVKPPRLSPAAPSNMVPIDIVVVEDEEIQNEIDEAIDLLYLFDLIPKPGMTIRQCVSWIIKQPRQLWSERLPLRAEFDATHEILDCHSHDNPWSRDQIEASKDWCLREKLVLFLRNRILGDI